MPTEQTATVKHPTRYVIRRAWSDRGGPCGWDVFIAELDDERIEQLTWCNRYATRDDARSAVRELSR